MTFLATLTNPDTGFDFNFWLVTGTAAPVIALAVRGPLLEAIRAFSVAVDRLLEVRADSQRDAKAARFAMCWAFMILMLSAINEIGQAALLAVSLFALAYEREMVPVWIAIFLAVGGILALPFAIISGFLLRQYQHLNTRPSPL